AAARPHAAPGRDGAPHWRGRERDHRSPDRDRPRAGGAVGVHGPPQGPAVRGRRARRAGPRLDRRLLRPRHCGDGGSAFGDHRGDARRWRRAPDRGRARALLLRPRRRPRGPGPEPRPARRLRAPLECVRGPGPGHAAARAPFRHLRPAATPVKTTPLGPGREFDLIRRFLADAGPDAPGVELGPGDDCALFSADRVAISSDLSLEGVHFRRDWIGPEEIGYRAAAAALSDLAAMAARPIGILSAVAVPAGDLPDYAVSLSVGMREAAAEVGASVLGGDVARSPGPIVLDVTVVGEATRPVLRSGARVGDAVWVTG